MKISHWLLVGGLGWKQTNSPLFVTWNTRRSSGASGWSTRLRGCIGTFDAQPLRAGLEEYALLSAFRDHRFRRVELRELPSLECGCVPPPHSSLLTSLPTVARTNARTRMHVVTPSPPHPIPSPPPSSSLRVIHLSDHTTIILAGGWFDFLCVYVRVAVVSLCAGMLRAWYGVVRYVCAWAVPGYRS